jgi:alkanesulfonate monooxygenase SsuD/methylene tetrahydromethanopterin reductase-like flavin-dependent oxidoreductase (luciferase family)
MRHGFVLPGGSAPEQLELAVLAEGAGWDAVFVWEGGYAVDPWALLSAIAVRTTRIRLGTMLTPLPWRRPWKLASQVVTLDQLSAGRAVLAVGLGAVDPALGSYGEPTDRATRAALLDEGIDLVRALWHGERRFDGAHHHLDLVGAVHPSPRPVQPRIPIWVVAAGGRERSMQRALRCDGLLPTFMGAEGARNPTPDELREMVAWLDERGRPPGFDVIVEGETQPGETGVVEPWAEAGATWWLETRWGAPEDVRQRIEAGPVRSGV